MKTLILVTVFTLLLSGCATSLKEATATLADCRAEYLIPVVDENGVIEIIDGEPRMQAAAGSCPDEWAAWNEADERRAAALARREADRTPHNCGKGAVPWCTVSFGRKKCECRDSRAVQDILRDMVEIERY